MIARTSPYNYLVYTIRAPGSLPHQRAEYLRRTSPIFLSFPYFCPILSVQFSDVHNISRVTNGSNAPLDSDPSHKNFEEHYDDAVHFLGTKKSKQEMVNENQKKEAYYSNLNFWAK